MPRRVLVLFSRAIALAILAAVTSPLDALAQIAVSRTGLNIRSGQSTSSTVVARIEAGDTVALLGLRKRKGYFHVVTAANDTGWAYAQRLEIVDSTASVASAGSHSTTNPANTPANSGTSNTGATSIGPVASAVDASWAKVPTNAAAFAWPDASGSSCGPGGLGGDTATNRWKNRTDSATIYHDVSWSALTNLEMPRNSTSSRAGFSPADLAELAKYEGTPVRVTAFLSGLKVEIPGKKNGVVGKGESTNCGENIAAHVDWHMYITAAPNQPHYDAVVAETTPRVRFARPGWTPQKLQAISTDGDTVRISGWLMFDPEHWVQMLGYKAGDTSTANKYRITLWEIHPVTRIEVRRAGAWVLLEKLP